MGEPVWVAAHVFHRADQDSLITQAMAPLCEDLVRAGHVEDWFFLRYWEGGPHVRLRLRVVEQPEHVRTAVANACAHHLSAHPTPPDDWTQHRYDLVARRRATAERMPDWDRRLRPADTVEFTTYQPEHHAYGTGRALQAVERHFTDSSRIATALLTHPLDRRAAAALAMLTLAAAVCQPDLAQASTRFDSHLPVPDHYRDQTRLLWSRASTNPAPTNSAPSKPAPTNPLATWLSSVRALHTTLTGLRDFSPTDVLSPFAALARALCPDDPTIPCVVLRCTHLLCNRLGLPAATEAHLVSLTTATLSALHEEVAPL
ncbi:thiopeptide-type bacteriocin biosynthesis protein [Saccharothrix variisporea]|uniref:Thiopeptide-type bacteriocin biosynthesis protein n=1 Tax=Saccharothrix variisporea TaxID=543527 RepID=A0A495WYR6_9PSEU|nr:thiopeptide-type bacteriocin biosynthesis protein [Saccharothrix variisporea]RKT66862.1 thiopeptide-type bacteriocin biosynthesis protein [Saccharothrix variisporea]